MPSFSGHFELQPSGASAGQRGSCQVTFDAETLTLTPASGPPLTVDLGDLDVFVPGDYDLSLTLYTGQKLLLRQFGRAFPNLAHDLLEAYRNRLVRCLLLEDLEEVARFDCHAHVGSTMSAESGFAGPAEVRLYRSNLAILPTQTTARQWRLAEIDSVSLDEQSYAVALYSGGDTIRLTKLAKRTREFRDRVEHGVTEIREKVAQTIHRLLPFLTPDEFQRVATLLREGQPASLRSLKAINARIEATLYENIVDAQLKPFCDALRGFAPDGDAYTGFKFIRREEEGEPEEAECQPESPVPPAPAGSGGDAGSKETEPILHWFFFPVTKRTGDRGSLLAWEAASGGNRATYFFSLASLPTAMQCITEIDPAIRQINRALVLLNFRRAPVYLSNEKLEADSRYRRYAIACRKIPELGRLRASFAGRTFHTSLEAWRKQVESILGV